MSDKFNLVAVVGPTASGKTAFAARLASHIRGEIISADSRQIYRRMNLGTGKDYSDYRVAGAEVPCHLIDIADPGYRYSVFEYQRDFFRVFRDIQLRNRFPVLCGGSGMYIDAATRGYRLVNVPRNDRLRTELGSKTLSELGDLLSAMKTLHNKTDVDTPERAIRAIEIANYYRDNPGLSEDLPKLNPLFVGILYDRFEERSRITARLEQRLQQGMVDEIRELLRSGLSADSLSYYGLEYRYLTNYLLGRMDYPTLFSQLNTAIYQFAKRQRTWFRKMEREGCDIHWLDGNMPVEEKIDSVLHLLGKK
ncbi:MAG: tRNA (adenosine(37)-N6)-dimethylallyltransferase MiaA [Bacteroidales bacterium]|nr:tRNA (adenosine(37)-N6)-dimethylallyltransferase MiaA [Bacteroidales bacterium]